MWSVVVEELWFKGPPTEFLLLGNDDIERRFSWREVLPEASAPAAWLVGKLLRLLMISCRDWRVLGVPSFPLSWPS